MPPSPCEGSGGVPIAHRAWLGDRQVSRAGNGHRQVQMFEGVGSVLACMFQCFRF